MHDRLREVLHLRWQERKALPLKFTLSHRAFTELLAEPSPNFELRYMPDATTFRGITVAAAANQESDIQVICERFIDCMVGEFTIEQPNVPTDYESFILHSTGLADGVIEYFGSVRFERVCFVESLYGNIDTGKMSPMWKRTS